MSQNDARQRFNLDIFQAVALVLSEVTHLLLRKADIGNIAIRQLRIAVIDFLLRQAEVCAIELIELNRQLAHRCVTARFNIRQDFLYRFTNRTVVRFHCFRFRTALEPDSHNLPHYDVNEMLMHSNSLASWRE